MERQGPLSSSKLLYAARCLSPSINLPRRFLNLSGLGLKRCELTKQAVNLLAASPRLARMTWLDLSANDLPDDALLPLAESSYLSRLCELDIRGGGASDRVREILRERLGPRLSD